MSEETTVNCPTCGKTVVWGEQSRSPILLQTLPAYRSGRMGREEKRIPSAGDLSDSDDWSESSICGKTRACGLAGLSLGDKFR
jgi:endogenous inhibitor of DNA gyrase (YacG/DUF329 family)